MREIIHFWERLKYYTEPETFTKAEVIAILERAFRAQGLEYHASTGEWR